MKFLNQKLARVGFLSSRRRLDGSVTGVVVTVLFIAMLAVLGLTQFTDMADQAEGDTAMTEVLRAMNNSGNFFISKGRSYVGISKEHLGIAGSKNLYGKDVKISTAGTATAVAFTYEGFPNQAVCMVVAGRLAGVPYSNLIVTPCTNASPSTLTITLDNTR